MKTTLLMKLAIPVFVGSILVAACTRNQEPVSGDLPNSYSLAQSSNTAANETIRFFQERINKDPEDYIAHNKLASEYLQQMRETGDESYLELALASAKTSLEILPAHQNKGGLAVLALVKMKFHEFSEASTLAKQLIELEPDKGYAYQILGDALLELGEYAEAESAFQEMKFLGGIQVLTQAAMQQRLGRLAWLKGDNVAAKNHFSKALSLVRSMPEPPPETAAYCSWQLGEIAFSAGDYSTAERHYKEALEIFPNYTNAQAALGEVRAAFGDLTGAIEYYELANRLPEISSVAELGDLYKMTGRDDEAKKQYELAEKIGHSNVINPVIHARELAVFYADHDVKTDEAYQMAARNYEARRDIYSADALAWTALKAGKIAEAQEKSKEAMRLGTADANLFYHAGMIAKAAGDTAAARKYLRRAIDLNPKFSLMQAEICRSTLEGLK